MHDSCLSAFAKGGDLIILGDGFAALPAAEQAAVLAHEGAHLSLRHFSRYRIARETARHVLEAAGEQDAGRLRRVSSLVQLWHQRQCEYEADALAVQVMARAGYDIQGLRNLLERLKTAPERKPGLQDDHPTILARLKAISRQRGR